jgi:hypothetical protein
MQPASERPSQPGGVHARYTLCGDPAAEARIAQDLARLTTGIDSELGEEIRALLLVGSFARAEGSIVYRDGEPYAGASGYELLAVFRSKPERHTEQLDAIAATWTRMLHARVAIRAFSPHELAEVAATRFWFHAGRGWLITLLGDPAVSLAIPRLEPGQLRWQETPFAMCEGLAALALRNLAGEPPAAQTIESMQRAVLNCGDALLLRRRQYADTLAARADALDAMHASALLRAAFRDAIEFSAQPDAWAPESGDLATWHETMRRALADAIVHAEAERLGSERSLIGYLGHAEPLFREPEPPRPTTVQRLVRSVPPLLSGRNPWRNHPGERLLRASVALALAPHAPECRACAARQLGISDMASSNAALASALRALADDTLPSSRLENPFAIREWRPTAFKPS